MSALAMTLSCTWIFHVQKGIKWWQQTLHYDFLACGADFISDCGLEQDHSRILSHHLYKHGVIHWIKMIRKRSVNQTDYTQSHRDVPISSSILGVLRCSGHFKWGTYRISLLTSRSRLMRWVRGCGFLSVFAHGLPAALWGARGTREDLSLRQDLAESGSRSLFLGKRGKTYDFLFSWISASTR